VAYQYVHTSAKRGLEPGKSGFCCVACDRDMPPDLCQQLERLSRYEHIAGAASPVILRLARFVSRSGSFAILSRIQDSGIDYSKRNNHIAHHVAFAEAETEGLPDPATILLYWKGWRYRWDEPPRLLGPKDAFSIDRIEIRSTFEANGAENEPLVASGYPVARTLICEPGEERLLVMRFRRALRELPPERRWTYPFCNFLLTSDRPADYVWSATWPGRKLPYEISTAPRPLPAPLIEPDPPDKPPEPAAEGEAEDSALPDAAAAGPRPASPSTKANKLGGAPRVEIPQAFDRSKRRKPPLRWTPARFARAVNLAVALLAALCAATAYYVYVRHKNARLEAEPASPASAAAEAGRETEGAAPDPAEAAPSPEVLLEQWEDLARAGGLLEETERARALANALARAGRDSPLRKLAFVNELASLAQAPSPKPLPVDPAWLRHSPGATALASPLRPYASRAAAGRPLALLPRALLQPLEQLPVPSKADPAWLEALAAGRFSADDLLLALDRFRLEKRKALAALPIDSRDAAQGFRDLKRSLLEDRSLQPLLSLGEAFGLSADQGYLHFPEPHRLASPESIDYLDWAQTRFEDFALPRYAEFDPTPSFVDALRRLGARETATPAQRLETLNDAIAAASPSPAIAPAWRRIRQVWVKALRRDDLMEQTILVYQIEQLQEAKGRLAALQERFDAQAWNRLEALERTEDAHARIEAALAAPPGQQEWIVIPKRSLTKPNHASLSRN